jgi:hypothetical protein
MAGILAAESRSEGGLMAGKQNINTIPDPQLTDALYQLKLDISRTLNAVKVGQIQSFDSTRRTAQVQILFKRILNDGTIADYPVLVDCPVFTLQGGGGAIEFPISAGDQCLLLFADRNLDAWFQNGNAAAPFDARCHDLSDGIAVVGLNALGSTLPAYLSDTAQFAYDGASVALSGGTIAIQNVTTTLLTLLNAFIDVLTALTVQDGGSTLPLTAAAIAALNAFKLQWAVLLQ